MPQKRHFFVRLVQMIGDIIQCGIHGVTHALHGFSHRGLAAILGGTTHHIYGNAGRRTDQQPATKCGYFHVFHSFFGLWKVCPQDRKKHDEMIAKAQKKRYNTQKDSSAYFFILRKIGEKFLPKRKENGK